MRGGGGSGHIARLVRGNETPGTRTAQSTSKKMVTNGVRMTAAAAALTVEVSAETVGTSGSAATARVVSGAVGDISPDQGAPAAGCSSKDSGSQGGENISAEGIDGAVCPP